MKITGLLEVLRRHLRTHGDREVIATWEGTRHSIDAENIYLTKAGDLYINVDENYRKETEAVDPRELEGAAVDAEIGMSSEPSAFNISAFEAWIKTGEAQDGNAMHPLFLAGFSAAMELAHQRLSDAGAQHWDDFERAYIDSTELLPQR